ncbi:sugar nucleotide-binding protein [Bacillus hwajinpoensis]|uniref:dTDP-4-dehydrorhamnose reductase n=1 Tax=Guptibacillus hwajinpoensis TaxID=208199 RepID=A0A845EY48_9BACL|nr:sugar nucleotide-binding protein [Pseudalkalibacillus hwajinpoensis]MYL63443.1 sugar nucleotide-binding protein [Pseudalkalibacillus hwajinpoensis]
MKKLLIIGASGLIGKAIIDECKNDFEVYGTYHSNKTGLSTDKQFQLGLQQHDKLKEIIRLVQPDIIVSCLRGEFDQQLEFHSQLALELQNTQSLLYYFSTANVFDGDFSKHHVETDIPVAESDYGNFKIKCENTLKQILGDRAIVIRIPAIWGKESPRMNLIRESIEGNMTIGAYSNLECNNLLDTQLAKQLRFIIEKDLKGIFHLGSVDMMTQEKFFEALIEALSGKSEILKSMLFHDRESTFYFGLRSSRNDIPFNSKNMNQNIISGLVG